MDFLTHYQAPDASVWQGRQDEPDARFFQWVQCVDLNATTVLPAHTIALIGFCCDAGIARNAGRVGAAAGPKALRQAVCNQAFSLAQPHTLIDLGNIVCQDGDLAGAQASLADLIAMLMQQSVHPVVLGGGHEVAWGHYQGLVKADPHRQIGIINVDAHFDLRPLPEDGVGTSGTPFLQIANLCRDTQRPFSYLCLGIQQTSNTPGLFQTARDLNAQYIEASHLSSLSASTRSTIDRFIADQQAIYLTLCLDVFAASVAPGVSAPQPLGLQPHVVQELIQQIVASQKVISFDIAELSPPHDRDTMTAALAGSLLNEYLSNQ